MIIQIFFIEELQEHKHRQEFFIRQFDYHIKK